MSNQPMSKREALQDTTILDGISRYTEFMNKRYYAEAIHPLINIDPTLREKINKVNRLYEPLFLDTELYERFLSISSVIDIDPATLLSPIQKYGFVIAVPKKGLVRNPAAPVKNQIRAVAEFIPYQERVYARLSRSLIEISLEQAISVQEVTSNLAYNDEAVRRAFAKPKHTNNFFRAMSQNQLYLATIFAYLRVQLGGSKKEDELTETELDMVQTANLEFIAKELNRIYKERS